jgi:heme exporter protein B
MIFRQTMILLRKEMQQELRNRYAISGILLYVISTIFVCFIAFKAISDPTVWNTLFWIITLFSSLNAISRSFFSENRNRLFYLYSLTSPQALILAKLIWNIGIMIVVSLITVFFYSLFLGNEPLINANLSLYFVSLILGCAGFSGVFTLVAAIASRTNNNLGVMAILGFPIVLPLLINLIDVSGIALRGLPWSYGLNQALALGGINLLVITLSYLLFPYLWRE